MGDTMTTTITPGAGRRLDVPPLEWRAPDCPLCLSETDCDGDGFACESCRVVWPRTAGEPGEAFEEDVAQCRATVAPFDLPGIADQWFRCVLDEDHRETGQREHAGVRSDRDPWAPLDDPFRWRDGDIERGRFRVPMPVQGPIPAGVRPWSVGPSVSAVEVVAPVSPAYL